MSPEGAGPPPGALEKERLAAALAGMRVLVVDDSQTNRRILALLLESVGVTARLAASGPQALSILTREQFDLALVDVLMPGMDGYETVRRIGCDLGLTALPVAIMTANDFEPERAACREAGVCGFLAKPILPGALFALLIRCRRADAAPFSQGAGRSGGSTGFPPQP